jgi:hypothetical protein
MADTQRTLSALQSLLADNTTNELSPQDLRDFLVSTHLRMATTTAANYSATSNDVAIILDASSSAVTLTLPTCTAGSIGQMYLVKAINAGTNKPYIVNNVDGAAYTFGSSNDAALIVGDGTNYRMMSRNISTMNTFYFTAVSAILTVTASLATATVATLNTVSVTDGKSIIEVYFNNQVLAGSTSCLELNVQQRLFVDTTEVHTIRCAGIGTASIGASFGLSLQYMATIAAGTHSISVISLFGTSGDAPYYIANAKLHAKVTRY